MPITLTGVGDSKPRSSRREAEELMVSISPPAGAAACCAWAAEKVAMAMAAVA
jgi:hypothetical protein